MTLIHLGDRKNVYLYPWYIADMVATGHFKKISPHVVSETFHILENDVISWHYDLESSKIVGEALLSRIIREKKFFARVLKNIYAKSRVLETYCKKIDNLPGLEKFSNKQLWRIFNDYLKKLIALRIWGWVPAFLDGMDESFLSNLIMQEFSDFLKNKGLSAKLAEYYSLLSSSEKKSEVQTEELSRLLLLDKILRRSDGSAAAHCIKTENIIRLESAHKDVYAMLQKYADQYAWLTYGYSGPPMAVTHLVQLMAQNLLSDQSVTVQRRQILRHYKTIERTKRILTAKLQLSPRLRFLFKLSAELMYIKDFRKAIFLYSYVVMDKPLAAMAKRLGITLKEIKYLTDQEMKEALNNKTPLVVGNLVKERTKKCCFLVADGKTIVYTGQACDDMIAEKLKHLNKKNQALPQQIIRLKGNIAYSGVARGIAKIVLIPGDMAKVNAGDILVSSSTNPDLLAAMKRAAAFVTDHGGIISHAAIISRELKKPCVVGIRRATELIHDGDMVEVDANNGLVTILK